MPCYRPLRGYRSKNGGITWTPSEGYVDLQMVVACGSCIGCRLERSRQWSVRMMHEASLHEDNSFLTLTYAPEHLPPGGTLVKRDFQLFMKRLRKSIEPKRVSYFHCGEYGELDWRPHYHCVLFGHTFPRDEVWSRNERGEPQFCSKELSRLWGLGIASFGLVTRASAAYVARYSLKKVIGPHADDHYARVDPATGEVYWLLPEYASMSLRIETPLGVGGIGHGWFRKYGKEVVDYDGVVVDGMLTRPPRYYDRLRDEAEIAGAKRERVFKALKSPDNTDERLAVREVVRLARIKALKRNL